MTNLTLPLHEFTHMRRRQLHLTQRQLAALAHTTPQYISAIETGKVTLTDLPLSTLFALSEALGCTLTITIEPKNPDSSEP